MEQHGLMFKLCVAEAFLLKAFLISNNNFVVCNDVEVCAVLITDNVDDI